MKNPIPGIRFLRQFAVSLLFPLVAFQVRADLLISESFDYGGSSGNLADVSSWSSSSTFNDYVHDGGLDIAAMNGETGGAWFSDRPGGNLTASRSTTTLDLSTLSAGDTVWAAAIFDYVAAGTNTHYLDFGGGSVSALGFHITTDGTVRVRASNNGGGSNTTHDTGVDVTTSGTYLLLLRATKGTGTGDSDPSNSVVDFWFNPADTSSVGALGATDWTTGTDSKWGRNSQTMSGISGVLSNGGSTDEIRLGTELVDVIGGTVSPSISPKITSFTLDTGAGEATIVFIGAPETTYTCTSSTDLSDFSTTETPINATSFTTGADTGGGTGTGTADVAVSGSKRFYRLEE